jgi:hypothetical protein
VFAHLQEQQCGVIAEAYALLATAKQAVSSMVMPMQDVGPQDMLVNDSASAIAAFRDNFAANRIWFDQPTCAKADVVLTELRSIHNVFNIVARGGTGRPNDVNTQAWTESWNRVEQQLPGLRSALESDFRGILGVANSAAT